MTGRVVNVLRLLMVCGAVAATVVAQTPTPAHPPLPTLSAPRLYVIDCGTIISHEPEMMNLTREEVGNSSFSNSCFLVMHPKGMLLFDTGLSDAQVGRPIYENMVRSQGQLKFTTLKRELANIGVTPPMITYLALSHSHWDHVGNANDYAGSIWLARQAEYDVMFGPRTDADARRNYAALAQSRIEYVNGDHDVFGDGGVLLLSTPGHTPGHQSLYVKLARTGGVVLSGDLYHYAAELRLGRMSRREQSTETPGSRRKIDDFLRRTNSQLWIGHAIEWFRDAVKSPGWYD